MIELTCLSSPEGWLLTKTLRLIGVYSMFKRHESPYLSTSRVVAALVSRLRIKRRINVVTPVDTNRRRSVGQQKSLMGVSIEFKDINDMSRMPRPHLIVYVYVLYG